MGVTPSPFVYKKHHLIRAMAAKAEPNGACIGDPMSLPFAGWVLKSLKFSGPRPPQPRAWLGQNYLQRPLPETRAKCRHGMNTALPKILGATQEVGRQQEGFAWY